MDETDVQGSRSVSWQAFAGIFISSAAALSFLYINSINNHLDALAEKVNSLQLSASTSSSSIAREDHVMASVEQLLTGPGGFSERLGALERWKERQDQKDKDAEDALHRRQTNELEEKLHRERIARKLDQEHAEREAKAITKGLTGGLP